MFGALKSLTQRPKGRGLDRQGSLLALTLNNMTQGVVLFDTAGRLVVSNDRYITMYGLSPPKPNVLS
jgi:PAS domain-containing protein